MIPRNNLDLLLQDSTYTGILQSSDFKTSIETEKRLDNIIKHMDKQYKEYLNSTKLTSKSFETLLLEMKNISGYLKTSLQNNNTTPAQIFYETDADQSVGILHILWHTISFITRGNTKPQALERTDKPPLYSGRIIALNGDFQDLDQEMQENEYPDILKAEIASLYIPHSKNMKAIMKIKHLPDEEFYFNYKEAPLGFLLKVIEIICGGGIYHEEDPDIDYE
ncbi:MAG: hypothetical protein AB7V50_08460 [Vampirovibrionia bacterium]